MKSRTDFRKTVETSADPTNSQEYPTHVRENRRYFTDKLDPPSASPVKKKIK